MASGNTYSHHRVIFPVGQGGFAFEHIEGCSIIYDCGSNTAPTRVETYIKLLEIHGIQTIDYLVISHFDNDHVNGLKFLLDNQFNVRNVVVPAIDQSLKVVFNVFVDGAYNRLYALSEEYRDLEIIPIEPEEERNYSGIKSLWEWHIKNLMTKDYFDNLKTELENNGIDLTKLNNEEYIESQHNAINKIFKKLGQGGPNANGLIMLSQKSAQANLESADLTRGCHHCFPCHVLVVEYDFPLDCAELTSCLYVGDADLKSRNLTAVNNFWKSMRHEEALLLMQIPHHGSKYNSDDQLPKAFPAKYYFVCDKDNTRFSKNSIAQMGLSNVLMVRDICCDLIFGVTHVY